jgi:hypothetical protein
MAEVEHHFPDNIPCGLFKPMHAQVIKHYSLAEIIGAAIGLIVHLEGTSVLGSDIRRAGRVVHSKCLANVDVACAKAIPEQRDE